MTTGGDLQIREVGFDKIEVLIVSAVDIPWISTFDGNFVFDQAVKNY